MEALYPFLYSETSDLAAVLAQVRGLHGGQGRGDRRAAPVGGRARESRGWPAAPQDMAARFAAGGRLFAFGNGGSATDAQQLATLFLNPGDGMTALPAFGLANDTSVVTALCNDIGVEVVFARQLAAFGTAGGHRGRAVHQRQLREPGARLRRGEPARDAHHRPGRLRGRQAMAELDSIDYLFVAPSTSVHRIQEAQTTIYHVLWELTLAALAPRRAST